MACFPSRRVPSLGSCTIINGCRKELTNSIHVIGDASLPSSTYLIGNLRPCRRAGSSDRGGHRGDLFLGGFQKCGDGLGRMHALQIFVLLEELASGRERFPLLLGKVVTGYSAREAIFSFSLS